MRNETPFLQYNHGCLMKNDSTKSTMSVEADRTRRYWPKLDQSEAVILTWDVLIQSRNTLVLGGHRYYALKQKKMDRRKNWNILGLLTQWRVLLDQKTFRIARRNLWPISGSCSAPGTCPCKCCLPSPIVCHIRRWMSTRIGPEKYYIQRDGNHTLHNKIFNYWQRV